jgi:hypothetical protein
VVAGPGWLARSWIPSATAWVISSSHSRSVGAAGALERSPGGGAGGVGSRAGDALEQAATNVQTIHRTMHRC